VVIEGVSLVQNYRTQFGQILLNESPDALITKIAAKKS
jgi:phospholipid transport system substrate-binding protein